MTDGAGDIGGLGGDAAEYLQIFLDETEEQLDDLVETMLALEHDPCSSEELNEAFRLIHSIKGSAGMMGFDSIMVLTHHLESRFERFRSGAARLDEPTMNLVLQCIDFLRQCNAQLRDGDRLQSPGELLEKLEQLEESAAENEQLAHTDALADAVGIEAPAAEPTPKADAGPSVASEDADAEDADAEDEVSAPAPGGAAPPMDAGLAGSALTHVVIQFRAELLLADLKARLIVRRLAQFGDVRATSPELEEVPQGVGGGEVAAGESRVRDFTATDFEIWLETDASAEQLQAAASVEGVASVNVVQPTSHALLEMPLAPTHDASHGPALESPREGSVPTTPGTGPVHQESGATAGPDKPAAKVAETMRVDIDRLDSLMNLAGELVVNRARFVQISGQISPALRKASMLNRVREFSDNLRTMIESFEGAREEQVDWSAQVQQLRVGLELMEEQAEIWDNGRSCFGQIGEAIDQLTRVSHNLQRGVLGIRMVPVGPLFNRFKRVVRDLSKQRGKIVELVIRGEKTELDKRMIDELGDPLVHLVRNSIDHGMESPEVRVGCGKSEVGTITLEASHSGNNVFIRVRDDGGGIDVSKIRSRLVTKQILPKEAAAELTDTQALSYIWHPGFSTAERVTDVSGRGVGMDVVKTRVKQLNGIIEIESTPQEGTVFTIRLPLTLAIINSLLVRMRGVVFSIPVDDVREIVSVRKSDIVAVAGKRTFDLRDEYVPLVSIDDVFQWHDVDYGHRPAERSRPIEASGDSVEVVVLHAGGRTLGMPVDELLGGQDIVIKSLSDNYTSVRGLSGASILGDGTVCLMLDVSTVQDIATRSARAIVSEDRLS